MTQLLSSHFEFCIKDVVPKVDYAKESPALIDELVSRGVLKKYRDTRWNASIDKLKETLQEGQRPKTRD